jgi:hypothetical protein
MDEVGPNPQLEFTAFDPDDDHVTYQIQIDTVDTFDSDSGNPILNKLSDTDVGFENLDTPADTDPFTSGERIRFTVQSGDALSPGTHYWRVRAKDPSGSNTWGAWSDAQGFIVEEGDTEPRVINLAIDFVGASSEPSNLLSETLVETILFTSSIIRAGTKRLSEIFTSLDVLAPIRSLLRTMTETVAYTTQALRSTARSLAETVRLSDAIASLYAITRTLSETVAYTSARLHALTRSLLETVQLTDARTATISLFRTLSDQVNATAASARSAARALLDTFTAQDTQSSQFVFLRTFSDTVQYLATVPRAISRSIIETVTVVASFTGISTLIRTFTEATTYSDAVRRTVGLVKAETIRLSDALRRSVAHAIAEMVEYSTTILRASQRRLSEAVGYADSVIRAIGKVIRETIAYSASYFVSNNITFSLQEVPRFVSSVGRSLSRALGDIVGIIDTFTSNFKQTTRKAIILLRTTLETVVPRSIKRAATLLGSKRVNPIAQETDEYPEVKNVAMSQHLSNVNTHIINLPANIQAGDMLIIFFRTNFTSVTHTLATWTQLATLSSNGRSTIYYRRADGTEGATVTISSSGLRASRAYTYLVRNAPGNPQGGFAATETIDPPLLTPNWGNLPALWLIMANSRNDSVTYTAPSNYTNLQQSAIAGIAMAVAQQLKKAMSENPATFTTNIVVANPHAATVALQGRGGDTRAGVTVLGGTPIDKTVLQSKQTTTHLN